MSKFTVVLRVPSMIADPSENVDVYVAFVEADNLRKAHEAARDEAFESYEEDSEDKCEGSLEELGVTPEDFAHIITLDGHVKIISFGDF